MTLVAVVDVALDVEGVEEADATHAEDDFLLDAVFPVAAVEGVGEVAVLGVVEGMVGVEQVEADASDVDSPDFELDLSAREVDGDVELLAVRGADFVDWEVLEVLRFVDGLLLSIDGEALFEVSVTGEESDGGHVDAAVGCLFEVVASEDAKAAGVDFEDVGEAVFHAEVGDGGFVGEWLLEVGLEFGVDAVESGDEVEVFGQFVEPDV